MGRQQQLTGTQPDTQNLTGGGDKIRQHYFGFGAGGNLSHNKNLWLKKSVIFAKKRYPITMAIFA